MCCRTPTKLWPNPGAAEMDEWAPEFQPAQDSDMQSRLFMSGASIKCLGAQSAFQRI
jgi:hypothetical protein